MNRVITISVLLNIVLLTLVVGLLWKERTEVARAASGGGVPVGNGDVNADGTIDISDAVYTLNWLFTGGNGPVAIECPPPEREGLPATDQTKCYDADGIAISCDSPECPGQDGFYKAGCLGEDRFVDNRDGTVTDNCTGLLWQKENADTNGNGQSTDDGLSWCEALAYCENLSFAGQNDWRLPNVRELQSIVDYGRYAPSIDPVFGTVLEGGGSYWSSTSLAAYPSHAWIVDFHDGLVFIGCGDIPRGGIKGPAILAVRAVRGGPR